MTAPALLPQHRELLAASALSPEVIAGRQYRSVTTRAELERLGFKPQQRHTPALLLPVWSPGGKLVSYQLRPDNPRMSSEGKPIKYETPAGSPLHLDVHPLARTWVADPARPLIVTEGLRKGDAAVSRKLAALALPGVWGWRGTNDFGGRTALPEWEHVALNGRPVLLVFDSDCMEKRPVHAALGRLAGFLTSRGAAVRFVYLPPGPGLAKVGLDDFLAAGHEPEELLALASPELRPLPAGEEEEAADETAVPHRYCVKGGHLGFMREVETDGGHKVDVFERLSNFTAQIARDVREDDGADVRHVFELQARLAGRETTFQVPAGEFDGLRWVAEHLGARAVLLKGPRCTRTPIAVRLLSEPEPATIYAHLGWRRIGERWVYLHAGGALGANGEPVETRPPRGLDRYRLPDPAEPEAARAAVRASLRLLDVAPRAQTWPLLAAVYAAPLGEVLAQDFALWLYGPTGLRKSTAAALALCHYGSFDRLHLPANFSGTANSLELLTFAAKDALLVVDDYNPPPDPRAGAAQDGVAHRLLRGAGDARGRQRATADLRLRGERFPRCLPLVTAELPPPGAQSSAARTLLLEWRRGSMDLDALRQAQEQDAPLYPTALAGYLAFLAPRLDDLREELPRWVRDRAGRFAAAHGRVQESAAKLAVGGELFLEYARHLGAVTAGEYDTLRGELYAALASAAEATSRQQGERRPTALFLEYLHALLLEGKGYLPDRATGAAPRQEPARWGYRPAPDHDGEPRALLPPGAAKLGWVDEETGLLYLLPAAAHRAVHLYAQGAGVRFPVSQRALGEALESERLLALPCDLKRNATSQRCEGKPERVWVLPMSLLSPETGDSGDSGDGGPADPLSRHETPPAGAGFCRQLGSQSGDRSGDSPGAALPAGSFVASSVASSPEQVATDSGPEGPGYRHETAPSGGTVAGVATVATLGAQERHGSPARAAVSGAELGRHTWIEKPAGLPALQEALAAAPLVGLDIETTGLSPRRDRLRLLSLATPAGTWVVDCAAVDPRPLFPILAGRTLVGHHLAFDLGFLAALGFEPGPVEDTLLQARLLAAGAPEFRQKGTLTLAGVAARELGLALPKQEQRSDWSGGLSAAQREYAARDAAVLLPLADALRAKIAAAGLETAADIEHRCLPALVWMAGAGVPFDAPAWEALAEEAEAEATCLRARLNAAAPPPPGLDLGFGWSWDSPEQVKRAFATAGCPLTDTGDDTLAGCPHPLAALLREYRAATKRAGSYGRSWLPFADGGRLYPDWRQLGAASGRMTCEKPGLQQVPRDPRYRACFRAPAGRVLVKADYSQVELRIAARIARDAAMRDAYLAGEDLHLLTARQVTRQSDVTKAERQLAKALNFGLLYGMGTETLRVYARTQYGVTLAHEEAARYRQAFFRAYPGLARWHHEQGNGAEETRTLTGRRRLHVTAFTERLNTPVQGTGADGLKRALALLWERRAECPGAVPVLACHDELVMECDEAAAPGVSRWLEAAMLDGMAPLIAPIPVAVEVTAGPTWGG